MCLWCNERSANRGGRARSVWRSNRHRTKELRRTVTQFDLDLHWAFWSSGRCRSSSDTNNNRQMQLKKRTKWKAGTEPALVTAQPNTSHCVELLSSNERPSIDVCLCMDGNPSGWRWSYELISGTCLTSVYMRLLWRGRNITFHLLFYVFDFHC